MDARKYKTSEVAKKDFEHIRSIGFIEGGSDDMMRFAGSCFAASFRGTLECSIISLETQSVPRATTAVEQKVACFVTLGTGIFGRCVDGKTP